MNFDLATLPWLPSPPLNFRELCHAIDIESAVGLRDIVALSKHALNDSQLTALARLSSRFRDKRTEAIPDLQPFTLGVISNATTKLLIPALTVSALRYGVDLRIVEAEFNQVMQAATQPESAFIEAGPQAILLALDFNGYQDLKFGIEGRSEGALNYVASIRDGLKQQFNVPLIFQTVPCPFEPLFGSFDVRFPQTQRGRIDRFNRDLIEMMGDSADLVLDVANLAHALGTQHWFDHVQWHMAKLPFSHRFVPVYADYCVRTIGAMVGKARKCLVLDLDNTLWGGVIGDDGMDGIVIGQGSAEGEAFLAIQRMALTLRERGIMLAVSSKNDDRVARAVFREHPEMLLREEHISVFQANWSDKASNLEAIASTLNIGIDSLVFVDDNPAERRQVRQALPQVAVPELGDDPALYPSHVLAAGYFESIAFLDEDRNRVVQYEANAKRASLQSSARNLESYLTSLEMVMTVSAFDTAGRGRITQLINKSNQFNLTTRRYTEADVDQMIVQSKLITFQVRLADSFGDNGMISVVVARQLPEESDWEIDTWLMSCRVLGRGVERAVLTELVDTVRHRGGRRLIGVYHPTAKNEMVADHYKKLGFAHQNMEPNGNTTWTLDVVDYVAASLPIRVVRI